MLPSYLKIIRRTLWKSKVFAVVNILGLTIGLAACLVIAVFVQYERSFDTIHSKNLYRLIVAYDAEAGKQKGALSMPPMGPSLAEEFPEIEDFTRIVHAIDSDLSYQDRKVYLNQSLYVDDAFLGMFDFEYGIGAERGALEAPNCVILTRSVATRLFGKEDALGKVLQHYAMGDTLLFTVTGIMESPPSNSHLQFEALFSMRTLIDPDYQQDWKGNWLFTYLQIREGAEPGFLERKLPGFLEKYMAPKRENWESYSLFLQPLGEIHASSGEILYDYVNHQKFDGLFTDMLAVVGGVILLIAVINFVNLTTARFSGRAREVGIRKSIGARRRQLWAQFVGEAVLLVMIALSVAIPIVFLCLPFVSELSGRPLHFPFFKEFNWLAGILIGALFLGVLAGIYPALYFSSVKVAHILKGSPVPERRSFWRFLVVVQFSFAIILTIAAVFAIHQMRYLVRQDPGFVKERVMVIPLSAYTNSKLRMLKSELEQSWLIEGTAACGERLGRQMFQAEFTFKPEGRPAREILSSILIADAGFLPLFHLKLLAGQNFEDEKDPRKRNSFIINETLAEELLRDTPGKRLESLLGSPFGIEKTGEIIGIVKDFHFNTLHHRIEPLSIFLPPGSGLSELNVKIREFQEEEAINHIASVWQRIYPNEPWRYTFLDSHVAGLYKTEEKLGYAVIMFGGLAMLSSCLGLFALSLYATKRREKEIGIRKVLGASILRIFTTLSVDFFKLILIANMVAWPVAWYGVRTWLDGFAYKVSFNWLFFPLIGLLVLSVALFTTCFHVISAAIANPVTSLRDD